MTDLFKPRWVRVLAWTAVSLFTLYMLLCASMNWTGARMLAAAQAKLKAGGETSEFRAVTSEPVPDDANFCAIPALKDIALQVDGDAGKGEPGARRKRLEEMKLPDGDKDKTAPRSARGAQFGERENLEAWRDWLRAVGMAKNPTSSATAARDVLDALVAHDSLIAELSAGIDRPAAQWTPQWRDRELPPILFAVALPHYAVAQSLNRPLSLRAIAAARAGDVAKAHESLRIIGKLSEASAHDPFLIGLLVSVSNASSLVNALWEVCDAECGSAADFASLETALAKLDYKKAALHAWRGELAGGMQAMNYLRTARDGSFLAIIGGDGTQPPTMLQRALISLVPSGFFDGNAAIIVEREYDHLLKPLREQGWSAVIESAIAFDATLKEERKQLWRHPFHLMASLIAPAMSSVTQRVAYTQCLIDQATIACALERHRIEHGAYPESLGGLALANGKPLPLDALSEKPMGYRKTADGKYALWCVGFDGKDDGGRRVLDVSNPQDTKFHERAYKGDWVWDFAGAK